MKKLFTVIFIVLIISGCGNLQNETVLEKGISDRPEVEEKKIDNVKIMIPNGCDCIIENKKYDVRKDGDRNYIFVDNVSVSLIEIKLKSKIFQDISVRLNIEDGKKEYDICSALPTNISIRSDIEDNANKFIDANIKILFDDAVNNIAYDEYKLLFSKILKKDKITECFNEFVEALDLNRDSIKNYAYKSIDLNDGFKVVDGNTISKAVRINWSYEPNISESLQLNTFSDVEIYLSVENDGIFIKNIKQK